MPLPVPTLPEVLGTWQFTGSKLCLWNLTLVEISKFFREACIYSHVLLWFMQLFFSLSTDMQLATPVSCVHLDQVLSLLLRENKAVSDCFPNLWFVSRPRQVVEVSLTYNTVQATSWVRNSDRMKTIHLTLTENQFDKPVSVTCNKEKWTSVSVEASLEYWWYFPTVQDPFGEVFDCFFLTVCSTQTLIWM